MRRGDKKGQFYLIAAMIIATILVTFVVISNYSLKKDDSSIDELGQTLSLEGGNVIDYDVYNDGNSFEGFAENFSYYAGSNIEIYYIIGDEGNIESYKFEEGEKLTKEINESNGEILITVNWVDYTFEIKPGENFYYIISQDVDGNKHVVTN